MDQPVLVGALQSQGRAADQFAGIGHRQRAVLLTLRVRIFVTRSVTTTLIFVTRSVTTTLTSTAADDLR